MEFIYYNEKLETSLGDCQSEAHPDHLLPLRQDGDR